MLAWCVSLPVNVQPDSERLVEGDGNALGEHPPTPEKERKGEGGHDAEVLAGQDRSEEGNEDPIPKS